MPTNILLLIVTVVCPCVPLSVRVEYGRELPRGEDSPIHRAAPISTSSSSGCKAPYLQLVGTALSGICGITFQWSTLNEDLSVRTFQYRSLCFH